MDNVCIFMSENIHWSAFIRRYVPNSISSFLFIGRLLDWVLRKCSGWRKKIILHRRICLIQCSPAQEQWNTILALEWLKILSFRCFCLWLLHKLRQVAGWECRAKPGPAEPLFKPRATPSELDLLIHLRILNGCVMSNKVSVLRRNQCCGSLNHCTH